MSKETLPIIPRRDKNDLDGHYWVLPPEWSVANEVLKDKQMPDINGMPYISVPGSSVGKFPTAEEVERVLGMTSYSAPDQVAIGFTDQYKKHFETQPSGIPQIGLFYLPIHAIPDNMPMIKTGLTKRQQYITYYFGQALGKEDAKKFTEYYENKLTLDVK